MAIFTYNANNQYTYYHVVTDYSPVFSPPPGVNEQPDRLVPGDDGRLADGAHHHGRDVDHAGHVVV